MTKTKILFSFFMSIMSLNAWSQAKYSNEFLAIGVGGRGIAMGLATTASVSDGTGAYWNPSAITLVKSNLQVNIMHSEYFAGIAKYDYGTVVAKIDNTRAIGFSLIRFGVDDIPDTSELIDASGNINYDRLKSFSSADYAFLFTYAKNAKKEGLRYGGNVKVINRKVGEYAKAWGFGFDLGAQYDKGNWKLGITGRDITSTFNAWKFNTEKLEEVFTLTGNEIPQNSTEVTLPKLIAGAAYQWKPISKLTVLPEVNFDFTFDGKRNVLIKSEAVSIEPHMGLELAYNDFIFVRGGVTNIQKVTDVDNVESTAVQPSLGIGLRLKNLSIDYALSKPGNDNALASNIFSLKLDIYKQAK